MISEFIMPYLLIPESCMPILKILHHGFSQNYTELSKKLFLTGLTGFFGFFIFLNLQTRLRKYNPAQRREKGS